MIINCPCGEKKFEIDEKLIPAKGRLLQCGSCDQTWFFDKNIQTERNIDYPIFSSIKEPKKDPIDDIKKIKKSVHQKIPNINEIKGSEMIKYQSKSNFSFVNFLSYILVLIISFVGFIIVLDTFKLPLYKLFPNLEFLLFSLYETLKDVELFIKDLI